MNILIILKSKTNEHGNNVTDSTPIQKIKIAIQKIKVYKSLMNTLNINKKKKG